MDQMRIHRIRKEEKLYHDDCYKNARLFEPGSWLHKPVKTVIDLLEELKTGQPVKVLDLGCGVGRNSLPIAQMLPDSQVVCVDILDSAIKKIMEYSKQYKVESQISPYHADIADYEIIQGAFDYIIAVSSLEHLESRKLLKDVIERMRIGTRRGGINCLIVNTDVQEKHARTGKRQEPLIEVNVSTEEMLLILRNVYRGWEECMVRSKKLEYDITRQGEPVTLTTTALTFVVRNQK